MPRIDGKFLRMVGYSEGIGYNGWATDMEMNLRRADMMLYGIVKKVFQPDIPASPADGDTYICDGTGGTLSAGHSYEVARYRAATTSWEYFIPKAGWKFWDEWTSSYWYYDGAQWTGTFTVGGALAVGSSVNCYELRTANVIRVTNGGTGQFTGLTSSGGGTISGGKFTLAAPAAGYAPFNIPTTGTNPTAPAAGDIWADSFVFTVYNRGFHSVRGASSTAGNGSYLQFTDAITATKGWILQLGVNNTLDFWNYASSSWGTIPKAKMTPTGSIGRVQSSDVTAATTQTKTITLPAEDGLFELSLVATVNNANAYGIRAMRVGLVSYSAYPYTAFGAVVNVISDQSQFLTGPAPTVSVTSAVNGVITITVTGTGTKKLDTNLIKVCDSQPI